MSDISRDNHFVPQAHLRRWSDDGTSIFARRLLVSHDDVPEWERRRIRGVAVQRDLYTASPGGDESDDFERWVAREFEEPASQAIERVTQGRRLSRDDWRSLVRYFGLQDARTPSSFRDQMQRWERDLPKTIESTVQDGLRDFQRDRHAEHPTRMLRSAPFEDLFTISVDRASVPGGQSYVRVEVTLGRALWLASIRSVLSGRAVEALLGHKWSIVELEGDDEWPLTDHPAVKLNYTSPEQYDFRGGWGRRNVDLMLPLTPKHLLFTQVGNDFGRRLSLSRSQTRELRKLILRRADRWVFARSPDPIVTKLTPRIVDKQLFERESTLWRRWSNDQRESEAGRRTRP